MHTTVDRRRILLVEDDPALTAVLSEALAEVVADVRVVHDGPAAIREWERYRPDAIVLDLRLPGPLDGIDVYQEIRRRAGSPPPTLLVSGASEASPSARALNVPLIQKPFGIGEFLEAVRQVNV